MKEPYGKSVSLLPFRTYGFVSMIKRQARYFASNLKKKKGRKYNMLSVVIKCLSVAQGQ